MTTRDKLEALVANLWWSWNPEALQLFERLNPEAFRVSHHNPLAALRAADPAVLSDRPFQKEVDRVYEAFQAYLNSPPRIENAPRTVYFCMEYGLHESLPFYAGGLGVLAGDHIKAASDLGIPMTAVGLFLREGYFRQRFDHSGWQLADYPAMDPLDHPMSLVHGPDGYPLVITVHLGRQPLYLRAWKLEVGRVPLYLLDASFDANPEPLRILTRRLYQGDRRIRLQQEIILGIGGVRLLRALEQDFDVYHMNEGHCAFVALELLRERLAAGDEREAAEAWVRQHCVFTTHTPVMAGHDRFDPGLLLEQMESFRHQLGLSETDLLAYGRVNPSDSTEAFNMTVLGLKMSRKSNGVSAINGLVARRQWHHLYPDRPVNEVPIGHITNGVHLPTWTAPHARPFLEQHLGDWLEGRFNVEIWKKVDDISDAELWQYRCMLRRRLVEFVNEYVKHQSLPQESHLNPDVLTIGFARRFATYKRAPLLFEDMERAIQLFTREDRPIQMIYSGKAHPADDGGKRFIQQIYEITQHPAFRGKVVFVEDYDMHIARMLVSGCDVWLNNPRRPLEASGTSGQKTAMHGGLNLSVLDGWWPEAYNGQNGWAFGREATGYYEDPVTQDVEDREALYRVLEYEVIPAFYERNGEGLPIRWLTRMRQAMRTIPARFNAVRMVREYVEQIYRAAEAPAPVAATIKNEK
ncbi:alpha-glucan phosphorylase [Rhodothermus marinus SG0.5JP17-172]|uniref:alpha-glucan family phosphorylase n=1 Tax=Rhodothermus marinus TaxID=29549 RepID=UPI000223DC6E|nr:alpha-glucan family phosphorylase [Rhodothermus marinus]AEN73680.1 alpha-glucan phosphorylase [Rhodothermus marinus SG0.5JP17-172]